MDLTYSIIIPCKPKGANLPFLSSISKINYPFKNLEIILLKGKNPSLQRNKGARQARGEILWFVDHDCIFSAPILEEVSKTFTSNNIAALGGPCILKPQNSTSMLFLSTLVSPFSHYKMSSRYNKVGNIRETNEKELIGCNLFIKKEAFLKVGGFKKNLYPNEENELLNRLNRTGFTLIYHPEVTINKKIKWSLLKYIKKISFYGKGRGNELFEEPLKLNFIYFLPTFFCFYIISLFFYHNILYLFPLFFYLIFSFISAIYYLNKRTPIITKLAFPFAAFIMHLSYCGGMLYKVLTKLIGIEKPIKSTKFEITQIKKLGTTAFKKV